MDSIKQQEYIFKIPLLEDLSKYPYHKYRLPTQIGAYNLDEYRQVHCPAYCQPILSPLDIKKPVDLNKGFESFKDRQRTPFDPLTPLIPYVESLCTTTDVVAWRSVLTRIACTPFLKNDHWTLWATKKDSSIFLVEHKHPEHQNEHQKRTCYWGRAFEAVMSKGHKEWSQPSNVEFHTVMSTHCGDVNILFGAEIDGDIKVDHLQSALVELKTSAINSNPWQRACKWWTQSFLVGIETIIVGYRDTNGFLRDIRFLNTHELANTQHRKLWNPEIMLCFLEQFLEWLKITLLHQEGHFEVEYRPDQKDIIVRNRTNNIKVF